ncbi:multicopper oxidase [Piloderma croceum F 1598]|uniref:Multicopper oxidase n=1 Tax=Piloderma croceum (strain F 1598) TaxID=765440 RepID=A0A0C3BXN7_PILCF|nr:multicopper oxidase [Piloderma croceum F 1598]
MVDAKIRRYEMVLRNDVRWPDGVEKSVITINGQFPGPTLEVRSGDTLEVTVRNNLADKEGTSLHWHGLKMRGNNSQDGTPGVTQCPIPPGSTYTYRFQIDPEQSGTFWYHSHTAGQRTEGLFGALIVHSPDAAADRSAAQAISHAPHDLIKARDSQIFSGIPNAKMKREGLLPTHGLLRVGSVSYDEEVVLLLHDWYHRTAKETINWFESIRSLGKEPVPDNVLLNGVQSFDCERSIRKIVCDKSKGSRPRLRLNADKTYRLRLVNAGSLATIYFSIDSHQLILIEADGTLIRPVLLKEVGIAPGQRYSVVLKPLNVTRENKAFLLRMRLDPLKDFTYGNSALDLEPKGIVSYGFSTSEHQLNSAKHLERRYLSSQSGKAANGTTDTDSVPLETTKFDDLSLMPLGDLALLPEPEETVFIYVATSIRVKYGKTPRGFINNTSWRPPLDRPLLGLTVTERDAGDWGNDQFVVKVARKTVVDLIVNNIEKGDHPFHMHGHHFYPLQTHASELGYGSYNSNFALPLPDVAPALRDTFVIPARGYAILRVVFDNPGLWLFHCHNIYHMQTGMAMAFEVMGPQIREEESRAARQLCPAA